MNYFSVPADFKKETIDEYDKLHNKYKNSRVKETYGNITISDIIGSGRLLNQMPKIDMFDLEKYVEYSNKKGISFNYTLNPITIHNKEYTLSGVKEIYRFLTNLYEIGINSLTITLPSLIELVNSHKYNFYIKSSTLCQIINANKALAYKRIGVNRIVVDESKNRDFSTLKKIRSAFGEEIEIIVNQICHINCIYRIAHYNMIAGDINKNVNDTSVNYFEHRCVTQQYSKIGELLKLSWVRPEDLKYYSEIGINYFKLQGRHTIIKGGDPVKTVKSYFDEEFDGNLMDLLNMSTTLTSFNVFIENKKLDNFIEPFFNNDNFCSNNCLQCKYCENFSKKCIDVEKTKQIKEMSKSFFNDYDQYTQLINLVKQEENSIVENSRETVQQNDDFNF